MERMRRYAKEFGFESPVEEEEEVWKIFDKQPEKMLRCFQQTGLGDTEVEMQAVRRLQEF